MLGNERVRHWNLKINKMKYTFVGIVLILCYAVVLDDCKTYEAKKVVSEQQLDSALYMFGITAYLPEPLEYQMKEPEAVKRKLGSFTSKIWPKSLDGYVHWRVKWYDGTDEVHIKVASYVNSVYKNVKIEWGVTDNPTHIVSFIPNNQSWSYVGTDCQYIASTGKITTQLGWALQYINNQGNELFGVSVHEFNHSACFTHTLQSPACVGVLIPQKDVIYADASRAYGWDKGTVDAQILTPYTSAEVLDENCDINSIQCYEMRPGWYKYANGQPATNHRNSYLTAQDQAKIDKIYPASGIVIVDTSEAGTNVAKGAKAFQSSEYGGYPAANAIDGKMNTFNHTNAEIAPWLYLDLGSIKDIKNVKVYSRQDCCNGRIRNLKVWAFNDMLPIVGDYNQPNPVFSQTGYLQPNQSLDIPVNAKARYIKIQCQALNGVTYLHLAELKVYSNGSSVICKDSTIKYRVLRDSFATIIICK